MRETAGDRGLIQRCQWHKRENIVGHLPKSDRKKWRRKLRRAYRKPTYGEAKSALKELHAELQQVNRSAARSLQEGLEETLTLHRLEVFEEVGRSLKTTNSIENLNSLVEDYIGNVKRWHHSEQRARWFALGLLEAEQRMNRIAGHEDLPKLRDALQRELDLSEKNREEGPPTTEGRSESKGPAGSSSGNLSKPGKNAPLGEMRDEKWLPPAVKEIPRFRFAPLGMTHC
ncbi:MAG: hypothetical protein BRD32_04795 [Bacteroidetes bacterium QH_2_64_74]|nr:MAG: hypothetical protein BRD32_04795 [Bacteroidetes bacterium QH_2_64_74]